MSYFVSCKDCLSFSTGKCSKGRKHIRCGDVGDYCDDYVDKIQSIDDLIEVYGSIQGGDLD